MDQVPIKILKPRVCHVETTLLFGTKGYQKKKKILKTHLQETEILQREMR